MAILDDIAAGRDDVKGAGVVVGIVAVSSAMGSIVGGAASSWAVLSAGMGDAVSSDGSVAETEVPRSNKSCAAGGRCGWWNQHSSKTAWWLVFTIPVDMSM